MPISQNRDAVARIRGNIADLMKQQSQERDKRAKSLSKIAALEKKISSANKNTSISTLSGYNNQLAHAHKELAKTDTAISVLEKKISEKNKELNRHQESLDKELRSEEHKKEMDDKKKQKRKEDEHRKELARLKEITTLINQQNSLRATHFENSFNTKPTLNQSDSSLSDESVDEKYTPLEIHRLNEKIDAIIDALEKLGYGQEIIFNEIDEMRSLVVLNKKTWLQTLKGKLFEMAVKKVIDVALVPKIIDVFTDDTNNLLNE